MRKPRAKHWDVLLIDPDESIHFLAHSEKWWDAKGAFDLSRIVHSASPPGTTMALMRTARDESVEVAEGFVMLPSGRWLQTTGHEAPQRATTVVFPSAGGSC